MAEAAPEWWSRAMSDFGAALGFSDAGEWNSEVLNLSVENGKYVVDVERSGDEIVLAVLRRAPLPEFEETAVSLLRSCSFESYHPFFVQVGLKDEDVFVLAARVERSQAFRMVEAFEFIRTLYSDTGL